MHSAGGIPDPEAGKEITGSVESCAPCRDLAGSCRRSLAWWGPAVLLLAVTASAGWWWHVAGWSLGLAWIGGLCLVNAARCGRVHCRFTGPFALAMALFVLAVGWHLVPVGRHPWHPITWTFILGWCVLYYVPEWIWGRYATPRRPHPENLRSHLGRTEEVSVKRSDRRGWFLGGLVAGTPAIVVSTLLLKIADAIHLAVGGDGGHDLGHAVRREDRQHGARRAHPIQIVGQRHQGVAGGRRRLSGLFRPYPVRSVRRRH